jgi:hypothetical protein
MTTNYSMFVNVLMQSFPDYVTDIDTSTFAAQIDDQIRYNIDQILVAQEIQLNSGANYTISIPGISTSQWYLIIVTCTGAPPITVPNTIVSTGIAGQGYLSLPNETINGGAPANPAQLPIYGVTLASGINWLGMIYHSTQGLTANPTLYSLANNSIFQVFVATCVEDGG